MKPVLFYILQVIMASGLLYSYYHFALRNKKFHRYNRFYLLLTALISSFVPFLKIPVYFTVDTSQTSAVLKTLNVISSPSIEIENAVTQIEPVQTQSSLGINSDNILYIIYFIIVLFLLVRIFFSINKIRSITKKYPVEYFDKIRFVNTDEPGTPFSFFRWLFWNRRIELGSEKGEQIFRHELFHIQQKHSWDIIFIEIVSTVFWINPFFYLIKKEIKAIHEFLADEFAIKENKNWEYAELLLMQALNTNTHLVNPFFHNQIKRRIAMITLSKEPSYQYLRKIMVLPIAVVVVALFAFNYKNKPRVGGNELVKAINSITVVVDPGHVGDGGGAVSVDKKYNEANLTFEIAKMIQSLGPEYNINVIMTKDDDDLKENAGNLNESLTKTVDLLNNVNPQAFIAIHLNTTFEKEQSSQSGIDGYVTKQRYNLPDIELASIVLKELNTIYPTKQEIKQRQDKGIFVLDNASCPSLLLECGYINNPKDISFITNKGNQEKIARAILKGLVSFANRSGRPFYQNPVDTNRLSNALVVINGVIQPKRGIQYIDTNLLPQKFFNGTVNTYFGKEAIDKYGEKAHDGVIEFSIKANGNEIADAMPRIDTNRKPQPLLVLNGKPMPSLKINDLDSMFTPNLIKVISVVTGKAAIDKYGQDAKEGAIEINTEYQKAGVTVNEVILERPQEIKVDDSFDQVFSKVEVEAAFPGGVTEWKKFYERNLDVKKIEKTNCPAGAYTVVVQFIVHKDGHITDVKALTNHGYGMEEEAIRIISKGPYWITAKQNGRNVTAYRKQPITFVIVGKDGKQKGSVTSLPIEKVRSIQQQVTNVSDIESLFGKPVSRTLDNHYTYYLYKNESAQLDIQIDRKTEKVLSFRFTVNANPVKQNIDYGKANSIKQGQSTLAELQKLFGLPSKLEIYNENESWFYEGSNSRLAVLSTNRKSGVISDLRYSN